MEPEFHNVELPERPVRALSGTQAVDRAAGLLNLVVTSDAPRTFTSLVAETGLAKSTVSRLLQALERHRLVRRDRDGAFRPGAVFTRFALRADTTAVLVDLAAPVLERLGSRTGETVTLAVPHAGKTITVAQIDSSYLLGATDWVGLDLPAHCTASGKVFYAHGRLPLPAGELERRTTHTVTDPVRLAGELPAIRRRGYAVSREEIEIGLNAVAAPVPAPDGAVVAAVAVTGPSARLTPPEIERTGALLATEARVIGAALTS